MALRHRDTFNEINITPLTDIFLVLLIIMMVIAPMLDQQGLSLMVPSNQEVKNMKDTKLITINVSDDGKYTYDNKEISAENLFFTIKDAYKAKKDGLLIQASPNATHGAVVKVMDAARNAGVASISLAEN